MPASALDLFIRATDDLVKFEAGFYATKEEKHSMFTLEIQAVEIKKLWRRVVSMYDKCRSYLEGMDNVEPRHIESAEGKYRSSYDTYVRCLASINERLFGLRAPKQQNPPSPAVTRTLEQKAHPHDSGHCLPNMDSARSDRRFSASSIETVATPRHSPTAAPLVDDVVMHNLSLPPCDIDVFHGDFISWPTFRDLFTAIYLRNSRLSDIERLCYLIRKTSGEAKEIVSKFPLTSRSFELAWRALKDAYDNTRILVNDQLRKLFSIPALEQETSVGLKTIQRGINGCLSAMSLYDVSTENWDPMIVFLCVQRLPKSTVSLWEQGVRDKSALSSWEDMDRFLTERIQTLDCLRDLVGTKSAGKCVEKKVKTHYSNAASSHSGNNFCIMCPKQKHLLRLCPAFKSLNVDDRFATVKRHKCCVNCLSRAHYVKECGSSHNCYICSRRHNTLLHRDAAVKTNVAAAPASATSHANSTTVARSNSDPRVDGVFPSTSSGHPSSSANRQVFHTSQNRSVLLGTAMVNIFHNGIAFPARALIDPASEASFVSERLQRQLKLTTVSVNAQVSGVNQTVSATSRKRCSLRIGSPTDSALLLETVALVLPNISGNLPSFTVHSECILQLSDLQLADRRLFDSRPVDLLLGADIYPRIVLSDNRRVMGTLLAQNTVFGWILTGPLPANPVHAFNTRVEFPEEEGLNDALMRFWELEETPKTRLMSPSDKFCEEHFKRTTYRDSDGRYVVKLPFKSEFPQTLSLGESRGRVLGHFLRNEASLKRRPEIKAEYDRVIREYVDLGHMQPVAAPALESTRTCYLPHHPVINPEKLTSKLRVVFNASNPTSSGNSLNDVLHVGPTLQSDLVMLITRWRLFRFVFNCDITQMYRQIRVDPAHTCYQRILYRESSMIRDFELLTVTFGVNCAPFLAIRVLLQLADDIEAQYPLAALIIRKCMYVDDVLGGAHNINTAIIARDQLIAALSSAGFQLRKWTANSREILERFSSEFLIDAEVLSFVDTSGSKPLGLRWNARLDIFYFKVDRILSKPSFTKREVLSVIAHLFDPVGWLGPVIIVAKMIMQQIWRDNIHWDAPLVPSTQREWMSFIDTYDGINEIQIPRWVNYTPDSLTELHVFSDASEKAYAGVIYIRIQSPNGDIQTQLLSCKTKVAPVKSKTLPRLELCGAVLASELLRTTLHDMDTSFHKVYCWTDSTIVLAWLRKTPSTWSTFVANRVCRIQENTESYNWNHVRSEDNPADLGSRGVPPAELAKSDLWWHGPHWLSLDKSQWNISGVAPADTDVEKRSVRAHASLLENYEDILDRFSSLPRALRVISYIFRFFYSSHPSHRGHHDYDSLAITNEEVKNVRLRLAILAQKAHYANEYKSLLEKLPLDSKSSLVPLNPFIDEDCVMRLNGRLAGSPSLRYSEQCPIILPYDCPFTRLLAQFVHVISIHGGNQLMIRIIRIEYWVPRLKTMVRAVTHRCKVCIVDRKRSCKQIMAALPSERTTIDRAFTTTGVDYAGPFDIKASLGRSVKILKGYVCVFVCFSTKAIHLEATNDLSSESFLAAFQRFIARRGCPATIFSDNGTNFVGATREIERDFRLVLQQTSLRVGADQTYQSLSWKFIPPGAPHMGGLWEAAVKSFKLHFRKYAQGSKFTFEEFSTLLSRIEACLNSRPLCPMSDNPDEIVALTPGHFLIGAPLLSPPEPVLDDHPLDLVNRFRKMKALATQFCNRWKTEYLHHLQKRYKWQFPQRDMQVDDLVVIRDERQPPTSWKLGRVVGVQPGSDGHTRVVDLRTESGVVRRPITKLIILTQ